VFIGRSVDGVQGPDSSPSTFRLAAGSPVYALANGQLIAARFPDTGSGVSMAFALVRHEVYHLPQPRTQVEQVTDEVRRLLHLDPSPSAGRIDYDRAPSFVYSLYLHLGRPDGLSFTQVSDGNPDWLNRVIIRKTECDMGVAWYNAHHAQ